MTHVLLDMNYKGHPELLLFALVNERLRLALQLLTAMPAWIHLETTQVLMYELQDSMIA